MNHHSGSATDKTLRQVSFAFNMMVVLPNREIARDYKLEHIWQGFNIGDVPKPPIQSKTTALPPQPQSPPNQKQKSNPEILYKQKLGDATRADINIIQPEKTKEVKPGKTSQFVFYDQKNPVLKQQRDEYITKRAEALVKGRLWYFRICFRPSTKRI